jgi:hypothetical protein
VTAKPGIQPISARVPAFPGRVLTMIVLPVLYAIASSQGLSTVRRGAMPSRSQFPTQQNLKYTPNYSGYCNQ